MEKYYPIYWWAIIWYTPGLLLYPMHLRFIWEMYGKFRKKDFILGPLLCIGQGWFAMLCVPRWQRFHNDKKKQVEMEKELWKH